MLLVAILALLLAHTALAGAGRRLIAGARGTGEQPGHRAAARWPRHGQAAFVLGAGRPAASPDQQPVPIASLAKVMTAYLTLEHYPLTSTQAGFTITITSEQAEAEARDAADGQSVVPVEAGEQLTERQLLEALLVPSGNNIAAILADQVAGTEALFIDQMNSASNTLGMHHTVYTDASGFDPATVSTAIDQLRLFRQAVRLPAFRQIVSMPSVTLPVAGTLANYDPLIAEGYAGKTGSDSAAEGCLAFVTRVTVAGRAATAVGVVLGQGHGSDTSALLDAAGRAAEQLVDDATATTGPPPVG